MKFLCVLTLAVLVLCRNPFLPVTDRPIEQVVNGLRATPQGVVDQIIEAYEGKQIELYKDLFPKDGSFRFFIAPDFFSEYRMRFQLLSEPRDSRLKNLEVSDFYYYWPQSVEIEKHTLLFSPGITIDFVDKPAVEGVWKFVDDGDGDSLAELLVTGGVLEITRLIGDTAEIYTTNIDKQVMLVEKGDDGLWTLCKWYDFSSNE